MGPNSEFIILDFGIKPFEKDRILVVRIELIIVIRDIQKEGSECYRSRARRSLVRILSDLYFYISEKLPLKRWILENKYRSYGRSLIRNGTDEV